MAAKLTANSYGKSGIRLTKVTRRPDRHDLTEVEIAVELTGDFADTYLTGDNAKVVATDTMKNTVYAMAATHPVDPLEAFGALLARHFLDRNAHVESATVELHETAWNRLAIDDAAGHPHAFTGGGTHRRTARVVATRGGGGFETSAGVADLLLLKTTDSAFAGFLRDEFTTLKETGDRIFATRLTAAWTYDGGAGDYNADHRDVVTGMLQTFADHKSLSVQQTLYAMGEAALDACPRVRSIDLEMPNEHRIPVNLEPFGLPNRNDVFVATREPYGLIRATVARSR
jgi:urate oxidase